MLFGTITTAIEVRKNKVNLTRVIKKQVFSMEVIYVIIKARHKEPMINWLVMRTGISDLPIFAFTYALSQRSISYFLSITVNNNPLFHLYRSQFEDEFGLIGWRDISRPNISNFTYDFLPLIDEHNNQRQNILNLKRFWPTQKC